MSQHLPELVRIARARDPMHCPVWASQTGFTVRIACARDPMLRSDDSMFGEIVNRCDEASTQGGAAEPNPLYVFRHELLDILTASPKRSREMPELFLG